MPIETDLSVSPYFDEAAAGLEKNYYKILFKPAVPVQVRELNELQSILQNQIEEFGDNILKKGTIIRGCTFSFFNNYPYVKINDSQVDGAPVNISAMLGKSVTSSTGHSAVVLDYADGFESTDPNTKTLYLRYTNSGKLAGNSQFQADDTLTVQDPSYSISNVIISLAGAGYTNSDSVVFVSALALTDVSGTLTVGDTMTQPTSGANVVITAIDTTSYPDKTILKVRPLATDLTDTTKTANNWSLVAGDSIVSSTNASVTALVNEVIGSGAKAVLTTDGTARVVDVSMTAGGSSYYVAPYVTVRSFSGGSGVSLTAQNYYCQLTVYNGLNSVGMGYGFGISDGVIYQKGYFLNVPQQTIVVSKYDRFPNNVSIGFNTVETIVDAYEDTSLLDNALGTRNYTAPGADRLQLSPELQVVNTDIAKADLEFFPIVEFSDGVPYKQNQTTVYSGVTDEMAIRTSDASGDFVTDQFLVACKSTTNAAMRANTFTVVVDPGTAYIDGYRVKTYGNYQYTLNKGIDTAVKIGANVSMNYGSYVVVDELAGSFDFSAVGTVKLYNAPANYLSTASKYSAGTITAPAGGVQIGTAKVRSINYIDSAVSGYPQGSPNSKYSMYLFDIQMFPGRSFKDVQSIFYDSTVKGIADVVLDNIATSGGLKVNTSTGQVLTVPGAVLKKTVGTDKKSLDKMIFYSGFDSPLAINTISYQYRSFNDTGTKYTLGNNGVIEVNLTGNEYFPYTGDLTDSQKQQLVFMPLEDAYAAVPAGGTGNSIISDASEIVTSGNSSFTAGLRIGDYVMLSSNSTGGSEFRRIVSINGPTSITLDAMPSFSNAVGSVARAFPKYVPLPILTRDGVTATASIDAQLLTIDMGVELYGVSNTIPLAGALNISVSNSAIATKTPNRDLFVKIYPANNSTGFGYSEYGTGVDGYFTSGSNVVSNTITSSFSAGQKIKVVKGSNFLATVGTITNATHMTLTAPVNFTGNADIYAAINLNGPWCLGVPDIFRLKAVYMANTINVNTASTNVTRDFVIDHNHTTNYIDLGYLVKKKTSTLVIGPNDYLLVKFDAFTRNYENLPVLINSYVSSNSTIRANTDAKPLSNLNNSYVNTLEIPEIHTSTGTNYDMISHIDFRPTVVKTANLATAVADATINPDYTVTFTATDKKFPVPDSNMSFTSEYFLGRIDTVYVAADGKIGTATGHPYPTTILNATNPDKLLTPVPNEGTMILNHIKVPAYPSIEENASSTLSEILNKSVINEVALTQRYNSKLISRLLTKQDIEFQQPRRYSMEDIGELERRIKDLEYYVALSNLELSTKDLNLPSSISKNINRFKFGFFADAFDDVTYTDVDSVEYAASIENLRVIPSYEMTKIDIPKIGSPFKHYSIVSQPRATGDSQVICVNTASIQVTQGGEDLDPVTDMLISLNPFFDKPEYFGESKDINITMASKLGNTSGQVKIYMNFYGKADVLKVFQSKTPDGFDNTPFAVPLITTGSAVPLTTADQNYMRSLPDGFFLVRNPKSGNPIWLDRFELKNNPTNGLRYAGKIVFNHNPANGIYYKIRTSRYSFFYRYRIEYPVNVSCADAGGSGGGGGSPKYNGTMKFFNTDPVKVSNDSARITYQRIHFSVSGLKPSTKHKVFFAKADLTHLCDTSIRSTVVPVPPNWSSESNLTWQEYASKIPDFFNDAPNGYVMTDASGKMEAYLYVLVDENLAIKGKAAKKPPKTEYDLVTNPVIEVYNSDKSSYAHKAITMAFNLFSGFRRN